MTNAEKFTEVFGTDLKRQYSTKTWWDQEFVPKNPSKWISTDVIEKIKAEITEIAVKEVRTEEQWARGLYYAINVIDKYISPIEVKSELSDMTNGEILKIIFPSITEEFNNRPDEIIVSGLDVNKKVFHLDWWNKLYKENK